MYPQDRHTGTDEAIAVATAVAPNIDRAVAAWYMRRGLPAFAPRRVGPVNMLSRLAPTATFAVVAQVSILVTSALMAFILRSPIFDVLERPSASGTTPDTESWAELVALATLAAPAAGFLLSFLLAWVVSRQRQRVRTWVGGCALVSFITAPLVARLFADFSGVFSSHPLRLVGWMAVRVAIAALVLLLVKLGVGAVVASAWQRAREQVWLVFPLAAKALPVTILTFLFAYFSAETWQVAAAMSVARLASVVSILLLLALALVVFTTTDRVRDLVAEGITPSRHEELLAELFPAARDRQMAQERTCVVSVGKLETLNLVVLQGVTQLWQAVLFGLVVWGFLLGFSVVAIPAVTESKWTDMPVAYFSVNDVVLPISVAYVKVCSLLSAVAALSFAGASATDDFYVRSLKADLDQEVEQALAVKHCHVRLRAALKTAATA